MSKDVIMAKIAQEQNKKKSYIGPAILGMFTTAIGFTPATTGYELFLLLLFTTIMWGVYQYYQNTLCEKEIDQLVQELEDEETVE